MSRDLTSPDLTLEHQAAGAGAALGCSFSSSDEFYAAIIHERRSAGAYGTPWYRGPAAILCACIVLFAGILITL